MKITKTLCSLFFLCSLLSCTSNNTTNLNDEIDVDPDYIKLDVVQIPQMDQYSCATTSVAMAIAYFEKKVLDKDAVWKISGSSISKVKQYGNDMDGLKRIADHYGYKSEFREGMSIRDIEKYLAKNTLVVVNVIQRVETNATHAVLVVGYDRDRKLLFTNDPSESDFFGDNVSYETLRTLWSGFISSPSKMTHRSGFIIFPKGK